VNADVREAVLRFAGLPADDQALLLKIHDLIGSIPFGTIELVMHQGAVVQVETAEKFRLD
jgi:hypothetical protein